MTEGQAATATRDPRFAGFQNVLKRVFASVADAVRAPQLKC